MVLLDTGEITIEPPNIIAEYYPVHILFVF